MTTWTKISKPSTSWTKIAKPSGGTGTSAGTPIGLLLALTYATGVVASNWTKITKPSGTVWTKISKAT